MERLMRIAERCSRAFRILLRTETAIRLKLGMLIVAVPLAWVIAPDWRFYGLLVGSVVALIIVEVLNTAIEAVCDAVSQEFDRSIRLAKDCGSLAVVLSFMLVAAIWAIAVLEWVLGRPI